jgi:hypothetical protein
MPKWLMYALAAAVNLLVTAFLFRTGRMFLPMVLGLGGLCFAVAAVGEFLGKGTRRSE